jgi:hypothetical protein
MTAKQRLIVAVLAIANVIVILLLAMLMTRTPRTSLSPLPTSAPRGTGFTKTPVSTVETPTGRATRPTGSAGISHTSSPTVAPLLPEMCQWEAAQLLAQADLGGTVTLNPDGALRFNIVYPLAPDQTADQAAQSVWTAFDIALALEKQGDGCGSLTQIEVTVLAQGALTETWVSASVSAVDLIAFDAGELTEKEFTERVTYQVGDR